MPVSARLLAAFASLLLPPAQPSQPSPLSPAPDPRATIWHAVTAVEGDSVDVQRARWTARLRRDPRDRDAVLGLATLDRLTLRLDAAERGYRTLVRPVAASDPVAAYARAGLAALLQGRGDHRAADAEYERASRAAIIAGDVAAEVQARLGAVRARSRLQGPVAALALLDSLAPRIPAEDLRLRASYGAARAAILAQLGRPDARAVALECVDLARRADAPRAEVACYQPLAMDGERRGDTRPAIDLLADVADRNRRASDRWALANTLQWRGHLLATRGEYGPARATLHEAIVHGRAARNGAALAWASLRLARLSRAVQDRPAAVALVGESVAAFQAQGDVAGAMEARELEILLAADLGDHARARRLADELLAWAVASARPRQALSARLAQAAVAERERDWATARARLDAADALIRQHAMTGWADLVTYQRGRVALRRGDLDAAERHFRATLAALDTARHHHRYRARARLADVLARRDRLAEAERELLRAGAELDRWRAALTDEELRVAAFQIGEDEDPDVGVPRVVAALAQGGRTASAFAIAEGRRARRLADRLAQAAALRSGDASAPAAAPPFGGGLLSAEQVTAALPDTSTALLEYVTGDAGAPTTLFVLTREAGRPAVRSAVLPPADSLAPQIARYVALLEAGDDPRALGRALGAALLDPALPVLPTAITRLVIVADGPLHRLPFDALRTSDGRWAVERFAIASAPSAAVAAAIVLRARAAAATASAIETPPLRLLAFGDPAFAPSDAERGTGWAPSLPRLAGSGREARLVARFASHADVRLGAEASEAFLKQARLADYRVIHFATHALVDDARLERTALALAPGAGESGFVTAGDLAALPLAADLVVLSACSTAGGVVVAGEGVQGLTAPLLGAGARAVIATGWRIDDRRTVTFVRDLYAALADGAPTIEALRTAKLAALARGAPPRDWAAFTLVGDPMVTVPLQRPVHPWRWVGALVVAGLASGALAVRAGVRFRPARAR